MLALLEQHVREPRMRGQRLHRAAVRRDAAACVERAEANEQIARAGQRRGRRRVEPAQLFGGCAPCGEIERERHEVGDRDLRRRVRREAAVRALAPEPVANAGCRSAGAARALLGRGARDALRLEPAHAGGGIEEAAPLEPSVDDDAHAVDRQARLGDVGREHDLAAAAREQERAPRPARRERARRRAAARRRRRRARVRRAAAARRGGSRRRPAGTRAGRPSSSSSARWTARATAASIGSAPPGSDGQALAHVVHVDGEHAAEAFDDGRAAEQARNARAVDRRRHREHA